MIISVGSLKGSVGKTTTALNLASALIKDGRTVQLVDLDVRQYDLSHQAERAGIKCIQPAVGSVRTEIDKLDAEFILIECMPYAEKISMEALLISDAVIAPVICEYLVLRGLGRMIGMVEAAQRKNAKLKMVALPTMYAVTQKNDREGLYEILDGQVSKISIPRCKHVAAAPAHGKSVLDYSPKSRSAGAFRRLAKEVQAW